MTKRAATATLLALSSTPALADDFTWTLDAPNSAVTTTITAETSAGTYSDSENSNLAGTFGGFLRLPSFDFRQIHLTRADIGFTNNPSFFLGPGSFFGGVAITSSGIGFAIPGPGNLGFAGPGPVAVDLAGDFNQIANGAEGRGVLNYNGTGIFATAIGSGTTNLVDVSPFDFDVAGNVVQVGNQIRLTVPLNFDETVELNGTPVRTQVVGTLRANATTTANGWDVNTSGDFANPANYVANGAAANVPGTAGGPFDTAVFGAVITADRNVAVNALATPRRIVVDAGVAGRAYNFTGAGPIRLQTPNPSFGLPNVPPSLDVLSGVANFDVPVQITGSSSSGSVPAAFTVAANASARFSSLASTTVLNGVPQGGIVKRGDGPLTVRRLNVATLDVAAGTVALAAGGVGRAQIVVPGAGGTATVAIAEGARLDVGDGAFLIPAAFTAAGQTAIVDAIRSGYAGGAWTGDGITSAAAAANPGFGVGYARAAEVGLVAVAEVSTFGTYVLRFTRYGDADLNLTVGFPDLVRLAQNYNAAGLWSQGDFDYDGLVGFADLVRLAQNYNLGALSAAQADALPGDVAADFALAQALVPEPTTIAVLTAACGFARRRRRA